MHPTPLSTRRFQRLLIVTLATMSLVGALFLTSGNASAARKVTHPAIPATGEQIQHYSALGSLNLQPHTGAVITNPTVYLIFEGMWATSSMQQIQQYFTDVSGSALEGMLAQYSGISPYITVSGSVVDPNFLYGGTNCGTAIFGPNTLLDDGWADAANQVYDEITNKINDNHWSTSNAIFFLFPPANYTVIAPFQSCAQAACGYHNNVGSVVYAVIPWGGGGCANDPTFPSDASPLDKTINTTSHEQFEAITDPTWTWLFPAGNDGWYVNDTCNNQPCSLEIGDKCSNSNIGTATHPGLYLNGHEYYAAQGEYDNATGDCVYTVPPQFPVYDVSGGGIFYTIWQNTGGALGPLGNPTDSWYTIPGGQEQAFQGGSIYWSSATGTNEVQGAIHSEYVNVQGGPTEGLGFPVNNELGIATGRVSYFYGNLCGAHGPSNSGSAIYFSSTTGAHQVGGCIYNKYWNMGGPNSQLNFPTSDVTAISGGYVSYFYGVRCGGVATGPNNSGSAIYSSGAGTFYVQGCVYASYQRLGAATTNLRYPLSDEIQLYNSSGSRIGWVSYFQGAQCGTTNPYASGGAVFVPASNNTASGGHDVKGCLFTAYERLGGPNSMLGFPVSDETQLSNSSGTLIGWASYFAGQYCGSGGPSGSGSAIYVPASNNSPSGGHEVQGCIYDKYQQKGGPNGLGFPITDEQNVYNGYGNVTGRENIFNGAGCNGTGSAILWSGSLGAHEVHGCIYNAYVNFGGPSSQLGLPTTDEYTNAAGQRESDFQGGNIIWTNGQAIINLNGSGCGPITPQC